MPACCRSARSGSVISCWFLLLGGVLVAAVLTASNASADPGQANAPSGSVNCSGDACGPAKLVLSGNCVMARNSSPRAVALEIRLADRTLSERLEGADETKAHAKEKADADAASSKQECEAAQQMRAMLRKRLEEMAANGVQVPN